MREALLGVVGLCMGMTIASGVVAFIISLGIVPRFAGITRSATRVRLYEDCSMVGAVLGNLLFLYQEALPLGNAGLAVYGSFSGIFLGSWVVALGEVVNIYAILVRRIGLVKGIGLVILSMALERLLVETDSPYVLPDIPWEGSRKSLGRVRNSSLLLPRIIEEIARLKRLPPETVEAAVLENTRRVFRLPEAAEQQEGR